MFIYDPQFIDCHENRHKISNELQWSSPEAKMKSALNLTDKKYEAKPLRRVYIEKYGSNKKRPLGIPTMYDRAMQSLYAMALDPIAEATGDRASFGFRKFRRGRAGNRSFLFDRKNSG